MSLFWPVLGWTWLVSICVSGVAIAFARSIKSRLQQETQPIRSQKTAENQENIAEKIEQIQEKYFLEVNRCIIFPYFLAGAAVVLSAITIADGQRIVISAENYEGWSLLLQIVASTICFFIPTILSNLYITRLFWLPLKPAFPCNDFRPALQAKIAIPFYFTFWCLGGMELMFQGMGIFTLLSQPPSGPTEHIFIIIKDPLVAVALLGIAVGCLGLSYLDFRQVYALPERCWYSSEAEPLYALAHSGGAEKCQVRISPSRLPQGQTGVTTEVNNKLVLKLKMLQLLSQKELDAILSVAFAYTRKMSFLDTTGGLMLLTYAFAFAVMVTGRLFSHAGIGLAWFLLWASLMWFAVRRFLRNHKQANRFAIQHTNSPEALVTGLARLTNPSILQKNLNDKDESWLEREIDLSMTDCDLTYGLTVKLRKSIAEIHQVSEEQMQAWIEKAQQPVPDHERPPLASIRMPRVLTASNRIRVSELVGAIQLVCLVLPLVAWSGIIQLLALPRALEVMGLGTAAILGFMLANSIQLGLGLKTMRRWLQNRIPSRDIEPEAQVFVSISPDRIPQRYEKLWFWDIGHLAINGSDLVYIGDLTQFRLPAQFITAIRRGRGVPSWWPVSSLYIDWHNPEQQTQGTWRVELRSPTFRWTAQAQTRQWYNRLQTWLQNHPETPATDPALDLPLQYPNMSDPFGLQTKLLRCLGTILGTELAAITLGMLINLDRTSIYIVCVVALVGEIALRLPEWGVRTSLVD